MQPDLRAGTLCTLFRTASMTWELATAHPVEHVASWGVPSNHQVQGIDLS